METTKLSAKGQVVLPKGVRDAHGWAPGVEFVVEDTTIGVLLRPKSGKRLYRVGNLAGMLKRPKQRRVSSEEMQTAITTEIKARRARGRY
jgi:AbrB family looped-hinge helix DNA binding protein